MITEIVIIAIVICLILAPLSLLAGKLIKDHSYKVKDGIVFFYHLMPKRLDMPDFKTSPYFNRYPNKAQWDVKYWSASPTVDDPFMKAIADQIMKKTEGKSDKYRAGYILKVAQCLYTYKHDDEVYGKPDVWQFPVCTAYLRTGDCEDGSFFGACLSHLCGLDAKMIYITGHAMYGVHVDGFGKRYEYEGKKYLICETTSILPIGFSLTSGSLQGIYPIMENPSYFFLDDAHMVSDDFDKYRP